jgi:hypothetical protein
MTIVFKLSAKHNIPFVNFLPVLVLEAGELHYGGICYWLHCLKDFVPIVELVATKFVGILHFSCVPRPEFYFSHMSCD